MRARLIVSLGVALSLCGCVERAKDAGDDVAVDDDDDREGEVCAVWADERMCGGEGVQYCGASAGDEEIVWGECLSAPACAPGDAEDCGEGIQRSCELYDGVPTWTACEAPGGSEVTPLVVVPAGAAIELAPAGAAVFDLGGSCLAHDWPSVATPWLAIDRDHNGSIDAGHELFGSATLLADGTRAHDGFAALAELDANHDGFVDVGDPYWAELVLWTDHDGDRRSTHWEHTSLAAAGITALPLAFERRSDCDARGNCGIERAAMTMASAPAELVDIHLACQ